jgi:hypothetical protein
MPRCSAAARPGGACPAIGGRRAAPWLLRGSGAVPAVPGDRPDLPGRAASRRADSACCDRPAAVAAAVARTGGVPAVPGRWTALQARDGRRAGGGRGAALRRRTAPRATPFERDGRRRRAAPTSHRAPGRRRRRRAGTSGPRAPADQRDLIHDVGTSPGTMQRVIDRVTARASSGCSRASTHVHSSLKSRWWDPLSARSPGGPPGLRSTPIRLAVAAGA